MSLILNEISNEFLNFINPDLCNVCECVLNDYNSSFLEILCFSCLAKMPSAPGGDEIINIISKNFNHNEFYLNYVHSIFDIRQNTDYLKIIHSLKYNGITKIANIFGAELARIIEKSGIKYDYIIPVPIHKAKERERGYNQAFLISKPINELIKTPILNELIIRKYYTTSQTLLDHDSRKENVKNIYEINNLNVEIKNSKFLIIDDVLTTGSTVNNIAKILFENEAHRVDCATIAFA